MSMRIACSGLYFAAGRNAIKANPLLVLVLQILVNNIGFDNSIETTGRHLMHVPAGVSFHRSA